MKIRQGKVWLGWFEKRLTEKRNVFIDKVDIYRIHSKDCYATLEFNHIMTSHVAPGIQICQCH